ncbi:MAG: DNA-binding protein [Salinibacter sp.]
MPTPTPYQQAIATLPAPCPTTPVAGGPVETDAPVFNWTPVPDAVDYRVQLASTEAFDDLHYDETTDRGTALPLASVLPDEAATVYWRVRAEGADDDRSDWSEPAHFAISETEPAADEGVLRVEVPPVPLHPDDQREAPLDATAVSFAWEEVPEASGYRLQVASTDDFADPALDLTVDRTTSVTLYEELPRRATTLYWRIRSLFRAADPGPWSRGLSFTVAPPTEDEEDLAPEAEDPRATARASGPVEEARTSGTFALTVSVLVVLSFVTILVLIVLVG